MIEIQFMIGDQIFGVDQWLDHDWQMYTVDAGLL